MMKWYIPEVLTDEAVKLKKEVQKQSSLVAVPRIFFAESANILWKKSSLTKELPRSDVKGIFSRILDLPFHILEDEDVLLKALDLALHYSITVYDGLYLASALYFKAMLVTADSKLVRRIRPKMRKHILFLGDF